MYNAKQTSRIVAIMIRGHAEGCTKCLVCVNSISISSIHHAINDNLYLYFMTVQLRNYTINPVPKLNHICFNDHVNGHAEVTLHTVH